MNRTMRVLTGVAVSVAAVGATSLPAAAATPTNTLESRCPVFAAWQRTHRHPMPGALRVIPTEHVTDKALEIRLIEMDNAEQGAMAAFGGKPPSPEHKAQWAKLQSIQRRNLAAIKGIVAKNGFPTISQVGTPGALAAWDLVQHADSDHAFQKRALALMKPLAERREVPGEAYAYLVDRVRVAEGREQVYGTQFHLVGDELVVRPVEAAAGLDVRRKQVDMPSEAAYLCYVSYRSGKKTRL